MKHYKDISSTVSTARDKVLIVEDEAEHRDLLQKLLASKYDVLTAGDGLEGIEVASMSLPDLILMDISMPKLDGLTACEMLRDDERTKHIPVIMISAKDSEEFRIASFEKGADDFIGKPYALSELIARISSKVRRQKENQFGDVQKSETIVCGNLEIDLAKFEVRIDRRALHLSVLELNMLKFFIQNKERVLSREFLLKNLWADSVVTDRTIDAHMACLRRKLRGFDHGFRTIYGAGYALKKLMPI
jgi:DNA-binding response OmpR family regulator